MRFGRRYFLVNITVNGLGSQQLIDNSDATKRIIIYSMYGICNEEQVGTYGVIKMASSLPLVAKFLATTHPQVLKDPASGPMRAYAKGSDTILTVDGVKAATNGFADIGAWIWGEYESEDT